MASTPSASRRPHRRRDWLGGLTGLLLATLLGSAGLVAVASPALAVGSTYYVNTVTGQATASAAAGMNAQIGWKSLAQVTAYALNPGFLAGDQILLTSGQTFDDQFISIVGDAAGKNRGSTANQVKITTTGPARATIKPPADQPGIALLDTAGYEISNLNVVGKGTTVSTKDGLVAFNTLSGNLQLPTLHVYDLDVSYFGGSGVAIGGGAGRSGFSDVDVVGVSAHHNELAGIQIFGDTGINAVPSVDGCVAGKSGDWLPGYSVVDVYVAYNRTYSNPGRPCRTTNSGNGIVLGSTYHATVERNVSYDNGALNTAVGGPVGIWAYDSDSVVLRYNESYGNKTNSTADGGGFDIDGGVTNSYMEYNYSHDNAGAGYLVAQYEGAQPLDNVTVRYNISQNDGRKNGYAGIQLYSQMHQVYVYGNTVYMSKTGAAETPSALSISSPGTYPAAGGGTYSIGAASKVRVFNNIFYVDAGARLLSVGSGNTDVWFDNNRYFAKSGGFSIGYGGTMDGGNGYTGTVYSTLAAMRAGTLQEFHGTSGAPGLTLERPVGTADVLGGTLNNADLLTSLSAYRLTAGAAAADIGGLPPSFTGESNGGIDFFGEAAPAGTWYSVGADDR